MPGPPDRRLNAALNTPSGPGRRPRRAVLWNARTSSITAQDS